MSKEKTDDRIGDWMQTATGGRFYPLDPRPEEIKIEDIAHALAHVCRFAGHVRTFYSVAEHSVRVARLVGEMGAGRELQRAALLHDAAEAYVGDMVRPLKRSMPGFVLAEEGVMSAIEAQFYLKAGSLQAPWVKAADEILLATEARDLMGGECAGKCYLRAAPLDDAIVPWTSVQAKAKFLSMFGDLKGV